jgi:hypothetical protein
VRVMAGNACLFDRTMFELHLCGAVSHFSMTAKAEFIPRPYKVVLAIRAMRVMAEYAVPFHNYLMDTPCFLRYYRRMAFVTNLLFLFSQKLIVGRGMRIMAFRTFSGFNRSVYKRAL